MDHPLPIQIALTAGGITLALFLVVVFGSALLGWLRKENRGSASFIFGHLMGAVIVIGVPAAVLTFLSIIVSTIFWAIGVPPIAYPFVTLAGLAMFEIACRMRSDGMQGCSKTVGLFGSVYLAIWGAVSFWMLGGEASWRSDLGGLLWLQPLIAALPFAFLLWMIARGKRSPRLVIGAVAYWSAYLALVFFTVEGTAYRSWLPGSRWLAFPLAGATVGAAFGLLHVVLAMRTKRKKLGGREVRRLIGTAVIYMLVGLVSGLSWALAQAVVAAF